jgi:DNA modification methylase
MGSGTTALSALKADRKYVGYDISEEYIAVSEKRLSGYASQTKINFDEP